MRDPTVRFLSRLHTNLLRLSGGRIGSRLVNNDMLLLTTTGRMTGRGHTVPLLYLRDRDDFIVIASYGGRPTHPDWYNNLETHRDATVQVSGATHPVVAQTMNDSEREAWWPAIVGAYSDYDTYQSRTTRRIPVVRLRRTT